MKKITTTYHFIIEKLPWLRFWFFLALGIGIFLLFTKYIMILFFLCLNTITALGYKYFQNRSIGIEFITLSTFVCLYSYGFWTALLVMEISVFIHMMLTTTFTPNMMLNYPISALLLIGALPFKAVGITTLGIAFTIILNILFTIIVVMFGTGRLHRRLIFFATHVMFNWFIFTNVAPSLVKVLA